MLIGPNAQGDYTEGPSLLGGYVTVNGQQVPGPLLQSALDYVNDALQRMANTIQADGEANSTAIILTAKHGQSPQNNSQLQRIDDGPIIAGVNAAWAAQHPSNQTLVVQEADDDGLLWWLSDRSQAAADFVQNYLWTHSAPAVNYAGQTITVQHSGLQQIYAGHQSAQFFGVSSSDPHHPDVFGISQVGTIYTTGSKIAEHGGDNPADRDVPLVVYAPGAVRPGQSSNGVETTQVAPTILQLLGLSPRWLQAVQLEGTQVLPGSAAGGNQLHRSRTAGRPPARPAVPAQDPALCGRATVVAQLSSSNSNELLRFLCDSAPPELVGSHRSHVFVWQTSPIAICTSQE